MKSISSKFELNNGVKIPIFGLGLYRAPDNDTTLNAIKWAWQSGYRLFDTAQIYGNENSVGKALQQINAPRSEFFVTTKLWRDTTRDAVVPSLHESLEKLQLNYVDLFLMHWPIKDHRLDNWDRMIELYDEGLTKAIGVSNFTQSHLEELLAYSDVIPAVNQMEHSPYLNNIELIEYCREHGMQYEAYSPLTKARKLDDPNLISIAEKYNKSPAQILIRWVIENDIIVFPKSTHKNRIEENADVFDFSLKTEDLKELNSWNQQLVTGWNPYAYE